MDSTLVKGNALTSSFQLILTGSADLLYGSYASATAGESTHIKFTSSLMSTAFCKRCLYKV